MVRLYNKKGIDRELNRWDGWIEEVAGTLRLPAPCIRAVLRREMGEMDVLDPAADGAAWFYWLRYRMRKGLCRLGLAKNPLPLVRKGPLGKRDSSTGFGQIFAYVAINAANYGVERGLCSYQWLGLPEGRRMEADRPEDLCLMWHYLRRSTRGNIALSALNLVSAGEEMNGHTDFASYTPEELQLAFTRYNANTRHITAYGRAVYQLYLQECGQH